MEPPPTSPVPARSPTLYLDLQFAPGATLELPAALAQERALYAIDGALVVDGQSVPMHTMAVLDACRDVHVSAVQAVRAVLIGGEPLGPRFIWWNFVSSRKERIVQAADDWEAGRFAPVPGETEFIPLPERHFT